MIKGECKRNHINGVDSSDRRSPQDNKRAYDGKNAECCMSAPLLSRTSLSPFGAAYRENPEHQPEGDDKRNDFLLSTG